MRQEEEEQRRLEEKQQRREEEVRRELLERALLVAPSAQPLDGWITASSRGGDRVLPEAVTALTAKEPLTVIVEKGGQRAQPRALASAPAVDVEGKPSTRAPVQVSAEIKLREIKPRSSRDQALSLEHLPLFLRQCRSDGWLVAGSQAGSQAG